MGKIGDILKGGMTGGLVGAAKAGGIGINDIARHGGFGLMGLALAKKKKKGVPDGPGGAGTPTMSGDVDAMINRASSRNMKADEGMKRGGKVKKMAKGGSTASKRGDGCATKGKTKGKFV
jgi:hypothetical protein